MARKDVFRQLKLLGIGATLLVAHTLSPGASVYGAPTDPPGSSSSDYAELGLGCGETASVQFTGKGNIWRRFSIKPESAKPILSAGATYNKKKDLLVTPKGAQVGPGKEVCVFKDGQPYVCFQNKREPGQFNITRACTNARRPNFSNVRLVFGPSSPATSPTATQ